MATAKAGFGLLREAVHDFMEDRCPQMAAALSYYTVFSLPPLLILILLILGAVTDPETVQRTLQEQVGTLTGETAARQIETILRQAERPGGRGVVATVLGLAAVLFGATGAFAQLQAALNRAWEVEPDPERGGLRNFVLKRVLSFGMILGIAFLLLVSLVLSAALSAFGDALGGLLGGMSESLLRVLNLAVSFGVITLLFAAIFKILPDAVIAWRDVWVGAIATTLLFVIGKFLIGLYLGRSNPGEAYGAAGSLAVVLLWIYYSAMILLLGAEITQAWAEGHGKGIRPEPGAVRVVERKDHLREEPF